MRYSRSHRRHHNERLKAKRYREELRYSLKSEDSAWALWRARKRLHTSCQCSCSMCANPRNTYGNARAALTFQELRAELSFSEGLGGGSHAQKSNQGILYDADV